VACVFCDGIPVSCPGNMHGEHTAETHCSGQTKDIITCAGRGKY
jgi:hypothetical protein